MGIGELLDKIREHYLSKFIERINSIGDDEKIFIEPAFRDSEGNVVTECALNAGSRVDVAIDSDKTETINFDFDGVIAFEQLEFLWDNTLTIKLNPFQWDYCSLIFTGNITDWNPLKGWYSKWFSENPKEGSMLSDCVHFISDPETVENGYHVYVDFGSAYVAALEEVFDAAKQMGAIEVSVGNA